MCVCVCLCVCLCVCVHECVGMSVYVTCTVWFYVGQCVGRVCTVLCVEHVTLIFTCQLCQFLSLCEHEFL